MRQRFLTKSLSTLICTKRKESVLWMGFAPIQDLTPLPHPPLFMHKQFAEMQQKKKSLKNPQKLTEEMAAVNVVWRHAVQLCDWQCCLTQVWFFLRMKALYFYSHVVQMQRCSMTMTVLAWCHSTWYDDVPLNFVHYIFSILVLLLKPFLHVNNKRAKTNHGYLWSFFYVLF